MRWKSRLTRPAGMGCLVVRHHATARNYNVSGMPKRRESCSEQGCSLPSKGKGLCNKHYLRLYRILNLEKSRQDARRYAATHQDQVREYKKLYRAKNRDKIRADMAAYRAKNRAKKREDSARREKRLKKNGVFRITERELRTLKARPCYLCGGPADTVDHRIPVAKGGRHSIGNLEPCCRGCNFSKRDRLLVQHRRIQRNPAA